MRSFSDELYHYGVKGMKWGVRRYQNKDGSLTAEGKRRQVRSRTLKQVNQTYNDVQGIFDTMSKKEKKLLGVDGKVYNAREDGAAIAKRFIKKVGDESVAFLDIYYTGNPEVGTITIGTRSGDKYRHKGYGRELVEEGKHWLNTPEAKDILGMKLLGWGAERENKKSIELARSSGFSETTRWGTDEKYWMGEYKRK